ncbi:uncharacterized protein C16orf95 homolog isoform X1 [Molossus molossus]|uniref:Uncharacterized protein n=2 Tax=Molossus molossus TaxID=27622 RepID=A0A7J8C5S4_MOLMO|nr:uncharacterized protein C16orf95 homolog isoform X1 [Molossus molossus]XP_036131230.1 uncharacterized protein C16orf95 homolog isoform X1 [Molossus molossus]KAF6406213.1 hypothetical protein HJG59_001724 [Molossus molossus]
MKSTFQTFGKEVCLTDLLMCPVSSAVHREPICCEYQSRFGGRLPVPRAEAALPYWVPQSLRPRKQIQEMVQVNVSKATKACSCPGHGFGGRLPVPRDQAVMPYWVPRVLRSYTKIQKKVQVDIPKATKACPCPGHCFGGRLPVPRDQAVMPYWVPRVLRSYKKVVKRQPSCKGITETPLDSHSWHNRWRICGSRRLLLKWLQLQALHQDGPLAPGRRASLQTPFLPLCLSLLTFLQTVLRAIEIIRRVNGRAVRIRES